MMRYLFTAMLAAIFVVGACLTAAYADEKPGHDAGLTKILVTFADPGMSNATRAGPAGPGYRRRSSTYLTSVGVKRAANHIANEYDLVTIDEWPIISLKVHCLVFGVAGDVAIDELLARLQERPEVESAQLMNEFEVSATSVASAVDPYANLQHNHITLELTQAHSWSLGDGTNVTIIDTGADLQHPELKTQIAAHHNFVENDDGDFSSDAHGTAVVGVIGAASNNGIGMVGVAPSTRMIVLKACWYGRHESMIVTIVDGPSNRGVYTLGVAASAQDTDIIVLSMQDVTDGWAS